MKITAILFLLLYTSLTYAECDDAREIKGKELIDQSCSPQAKENKELLGYCNAQSALQFSQVFYRDHYLFYAESPLPEELYTVDFADVLTKHAECSGQNEMCYVNFNPWINAQDGYVDGEIMYSLRDIEEGVISVDLDYQFRVHSTLPSTPQKASLILHKTNAPLCWKIDDMILPDQTSMKAMMLADYLQFYYFKKTKLSWSLLSSDFEASKIAILRDNKRIAEYEINCNVQEALSPSPDQLDGERNKVGVVATPSKPQGLLITSCRFGAHSKKLSVYDLADDRQSPVWEKTGSYFAEFSVNEYSELVLSYDRPCNKQNCSAPFVTEDVLWDRLDN